MRIITFGFLIILGLIVNEIEAQGAYYDNRYPPSPGRRSSSLTYRSRSRPQYGYRRGVRFQTVNLWSDNLMNNDEYQRLIK